MPEAIHFFREDLVTPGLMVRYLLLVFIASCGAIQVGAASGELKGLLFFPARRLSAILGLGLGLLAFTLFFSWYFSSENGMVRGLEGWEQSLLFLPAAAGAVLFSLAASSLLQRLRRLQRGVPTGGNRQSRSHEAKGAKAEGLEALKEDSYLNILGERLPSRR